MSIETRLKEVKDKKFVKGSNYLVIGIANLLSSGVIANGVIEQYVSFLEDTGVHSAGLAAIGIGFCSVTLASALYFIPRGIYDLRNARRIDDKVFSKHQYDFFSKDRI